MVLSPPAPSTDTLSLIVTGTAEIVSTFALNVLPLPVIVRPSPTSASFVSPMYAVAPANVMVLAVIVRRSGFASLPAPAKPIPPLNATSPPGAVTVRSTPVSAASVVKAPVTVTLPLELLMEESSLTSRVPE